MNLKLASQRLEGFELQLKATLMDQAVVNADETGSQVNGQLQWLHSISNTNVTLYGQHASRCCAAIKETGALPQFQGAVNHDAWNT